MRFSESEIEAADLLKRTIPQLVSRKIPTTPINFALWYAWVRGDQGEFREALEKAFPGPGSYDPDVSDALFDRFFVGPRIPDTVSHTDRTVSLIAELLTAVVSNVEGTQRFGVAVEKNLNRLQQTDDPDEIRDALNQMVSETISAQQLSASFQGQLEASQREILRLRNELESSRQQASIDPLTGIGNRRHFDQTLNAWGRDHADALNLIMLDVDHFKRVNDTHGHAIGDLVLQQSAELLAGYQGDDIAIARYGGEEFALILRRATAVRAVEVAEGLRRRLAGKDIVGSDNVALLKVSASFGVARLQRGESTAQLVERADAALYRSKESGRNRVTFDG